MEHFEEAERRLDEGDDVAAGLREDVLPAGVTDDGKLTYELVAEFEAGLLAAVESVVDAGLDDLAGGRRYPLERDDRGSADDST